MKTIALPAAILALLLLLLWGVFARALHPRELNLYVLDESAEGNFARELQHAFPAAEQGRIGLRVVVLAVQRAAVIRTQAQWRKALESADKADASGYLFVKLDSPAAASKKILRADIDARFTGESQRAILRRVILLVGVPPDTAVRACQQLADNWVYLHYNFGGLGLAVDDGTLKLIAGCLPRLLADEQEREENQEGK